MVVDDEMAMRRILELHLDKLGYDVVTAESAAKAMEILSDKEKEKKSGKFCLFVMDIIMPGENGITLARKVRSLPRYSKTPILIVSGAFPPSQLEKVKAQIPNVHFVLKPFKSNALTKSLEELLQPEESTA